MWASEHFRNYLFAAEFEIVMDRKAFYSALSANRSNKTMHSKLTRWVNRPLPFNFENSHKPGKDMGFTNLLSKLTLGKTSHLLITKKNL